MKREMMRARRSVDPSTYLFSFFALHFFAVPVCGHGCAVEALVAVS